MAHNKPRTSVRDHKGSFVQKRDALHVEQEEKSVMKQEMQQQEDVKDV